MGSAIDQITESGSSTVPSTIPLVTSSALAWCCSNAGHICSRWSSGLDRPTSGLPSGYLPSIASAIKLLKKSVGEMMSAPQRMGRHHNAGA